MTQQERFIKDEQELIEQYINEYELNIKGEYINCHHFPEEKLTSWKMMRHSMEFIVRPECNQKCQYCYIVNHGKKLYPIEERVSREQILINFDKWLNFLEKNKIMLERIELFAGDLFYDDIIYDLFERLYKYFAKVVEEERYFFQDVFTKKRGHVFFVAVPTNGSLVNNPKHLELCKIWDSKFSEVAAVVNYSLSVDGKYATSIRENKTEEEVDAYYDKIFEFARELKTGIHPMLSAASIENACKNYDWWYEQLHSEKLERYDTIQPMTFEVRNGGDWTQEKIDYFIKYLDHSIKHRFKLCNESVEEFTYHLFIGDGKNGTLLKNREADPIRPIFNIESAKDGHTLPRSSCSFSETFCITLNNFSLVPCHRLAYHQFVGGWFNIGEDGELDGTITPNNVSLYLGTRTMNVSLVPKCHSCPLQKVCMKGCFGAQFEDSAEIFMPIQSVCDLTEQKFKFLYTTYAEMGVLKECLKQGYIEGYEKEALIHLCKYFKIKEELWNVE